VDAHSLREIQQLVEAALARHGTAGELVVDERAISLVGHGPTAVVEAGHLCARWSNLPFAERQRECGLIARALSRQRRTVSPEVRPKRARPIGLVAGLALALTAGAFYAFGLFDQPVSNQTVAAAIDPVTAELAATEREREARAERVCNATRTRIARGGTVGPSDAEGWVVELALLWTASEPAAESLADFVAVSEPQRAARIVWKGAPQLAELAGPRTRVDIRREALPEAAAPQFQELRLTLHGEYVLPYFREAERIKLIRFSHALAEKHSATLGALYARCATGTSHHMGAWFLGTSPGTAASALLYYMGARAQPPLLPQELLSTRDDVALEPAFALDTLLDRTRHLNRQDVASGIAALDGMVAGPPTFTTLGFPFVDSDRALRASHQLSRLLTATKEASR
jgi:hypothetical protein